MVSYLYQAPAGVAGDVSRVDESNVEPVMLIPVSSVYAQAFGIPMAYVAGGASQWQGSNVAADFQGVLVREVPGISGSLQQGFSDNVPYPQVPQGICVRGYVMVVCTIGTPARGGVVYIRTVAAAGKNIGDFEAVSDPGNNIALSSTQAEWSVDGVDAYGNAELRIAR